jgi:uncharacterized protein
MTTKEILKSNKHRPWKIPDEQWKFYQEWHETIFVHWAVNLDRLRQLVPAELEIELFEGVPWVSLVAFKVKKLGIRHLPAFPPISNFMEINFRTYVKYKQKSGIFFLSIEGSKLLSCLITKTFTRLPYRYSEMKSTKTTFRSFNPKYQDSLEIEIAIKDKKKIKTCLDSWLTERYALFQDTGKAKFIEIDIHHFEWPLHVARLKTDIVNYHRFSDLIYGRPHITHYSPGVQVLAWDKRIHNP